MTFRTDGLWVWNDATTYCLEQHHLAPVPELVEHIRTLDYVCPLVDGAALQRASVHLERYLAGEVDH